MKSLSMRQPKRALGLALLAASLAWAGIAGDASAARIKDITSIRGIQSSHLIGYGLVIGLNGTGDQTYNVEFTRQSVQNMLRNFGLNTEGVQRQLRLRNAAAVMVTAEVPPYMRQGGTVDVTISSLGDATSLLGGTLLETPLANTQGEIVAVAQGPVVTAGYQFNSLGDRHIKNVPTVARIPDGAEMQADITDSPFFMQPVDAGTATPAAPIQRTLTLGLHEPDFTTASRIAQVINGAYGATLATALDVATVEVQIPQGTAGEMVDFIATVEALNVTPDVRAKVVVDGSSGTVVIGENVRVSAVAVGHENITVDILERPYVSQPNPFGAGETVVVPDADVFVTESGQVVEEDDPLKIVPTTATLNELVQALNALGVSTRDLISVLEAMKAAGALQAELIVK